MTQLAPWLVDSVTGIVTLIVAIVCCAICVAQAHKKGYNAFGFGVMGLILGIIGLSIALAVPNRKAREAFTAAESLEKYKQLLDQGAITQEEFDQKKRELL